MQIGSWSHTGPRLAFFFRHSKGLFLCVPGAGRHFRHTGRALNRGPPSGRDTFHLVLLFTPILKKLNHSASQFLFVRLWPGGFCLPFVGLSAFPWNKFPLFIFAPLLKWLIPSDGLQRWRRLCAKSGLPPSLGFPLKKEKSFIKWGVMGWWRVSKTTGRLSCPSESNDDAVCGCTAR